MDIMVRPAGEADYEDLCNLFEELDELHRVAVPQVFRLSEGPARPKEHIYGVLSDDNTTLLVAEDNGGLVGLIEVAVRESAPVPIMVPRRYGYIENIVVLNVSHRHGIGRKLMVAAEHWAKHKGATAIELNVWDFNDRAKAFFEAMGYSMASHRMWKSVGDGA
jgi:ribosomal protein S18 acetylase RimI-like enzyme